MTDTGADPMRHVWVLRHAKAAADSPDGDDHSRPLTKRGREQAESAREFLDRAKAEGLDVPRLVLCSSAARARETAEIVLPALGLEAELDVERAMYTADVDDLIGMLRDVEDSFTSVMIVGHNPAFADLVLSLVTDAERGPIRLAPFPTCAMARIGARVAVWSALAESSGSLEEMFVPSR